MDLLFVRSRKGSSKLLFMVLIIFSLSLSLPACGHTAAIPDPAVVLADYDRALALFNQLEIGMTSGQATALLGPASKYETPEGYPTDSPTIPEIPGFMWKFGSDDMAERISILVGNDDIISLISFSCGCVTSVFSEGARSTSVQFEAVKTGMTYD